MTPDGYEDYQLRKRWATFELFMRVVLLLGGIGLVLWAITFTMKKQGRFDPPAICASGSASEKS